MDRSFRSQQLTSTCWNPDHSPVPSKLLNFPNSVGNNGPILCQTYRSLWQTSSRFNDSSFSLLWQSALDSFNNRNLIFQMEL
jgi:hypothetical protein